MYTINQAQDLVDRLRKTNPQAASLSDKDLASAWQSQLGGNDFDEYINTSGLRIGLGKALQGYRENVTEPVRSGVEYLTNAPKGGGFLANLAASATDTAPDAALTLGAVAAAPVTYGASLFAFPAVAGISRERVLNETGDKLAANVAGISTLAGAVIAPGVGGAISKPLVSKLGTTVSAKLAGEVLGSTAANMATQLPSELVAPTGTEADSSVFDRAAINAKRLATAKGLGEFAGANLLMSGAATAAGAGTRFVAGRAKKLAGNPLVNPLQEKPLATYEDSRNFLQSKGLRVDETNAPVTVADVANRLALGELSLEDARYKLLQEKKRSTSSALLDRDDLDFEREYNTVIAPKQQAEKARNILLASSAASGKPDAQGLNNLLAVVTHQGVEDYANGNPAGFADFVQDWNQSQLPQGISRDPVVGSREIILRYRLGQLDSEDLASIHPALLRMAGNGDAYLSDLFRDKKLVRQLGPDGSRTEAQLAKLSKEINKQGEAYGALGRLLDDSPRPNNLISSGDEAAPFSFKDRSEQALSPMERFVYSIVNLTTRFPFSKPMGDHMFSFYQLGKADRMDIMSKLGQNKDNSLPTGLAFEAAEDFLNGAKPLEFAKIARALAQEQRVASKNGNMLDDATLERSFGIKGELLSKYKALREMPVDTARLLLSKERDVNLYNLAGEIYLASGKKFTQQRAIDLSKQLQGYFDTLPIPPKNLPIYKQFEETHLGLIKQLAKNNGVELDDGSAELLYKSLLLQKSNLAKFQASHSILGYAPEQRRGKYVTSLYKPSVDPATAKSEDLFTVDGDSSKEVEARVNKLIGEGYKLKGRYVKGDRDQEAFVSLDGIKSLRKEAASNQRALTQEFKDAGKLTPELQEYLETLAANYDPIEDAYQTAIEGTSKQYNLHRNDIAGFQPSQYVPNILDYVRINSDAAARRLVQAKAGLELMRPEYDSVPGLKKEWQDRLTYAQGVDSASVNKIRTTATHIAIGASTKNMLLNRTQNFIAGIGPMTEATGSVIKAEAQLAKGLKLLVKFNATGSTGNKNLDSILRQADKDGVTSSDTLDLFHRTKSLENYGNRNIAIRGKDKVASYLQRLIVSTNAFSEQQNRIQSVLAMADYQLARRGGNVSRAELANVYREAVRFSNATNYFGSRANRPGFLVHAKDPTTHNAALLWSTLKTFTMNYLGQLLAMAKRDGVRNKPLAAALGHLTVGAGLAGLPFSKDIQQATEAVTGFSPEESFKDLFGDNPSETTKGLYDAILFGLPSYLGVNASQSLGVGSIVGYRSSDSPSENIAAFALGAPGGLAQRYGTALYEAAKSGNYGNLMQSTAPQAISYWTKILDAADSSQVRNTAGVPTKVGAKDAIALATGFPSMSTTDARQAFNAEQLSKKRFDSARDALVKRVASLYSRGDTESARKELSEGLASFGPRVDSISLIDSINREVFKNRVGYTSEAPTAATAAEQSKLALRYGEQGPKIASPVSLAMQRLELASKIADGPTLLAVLQGLKGNLKSTVTKEVSLAAKTTPELLQLLRSKRLVDKQRAIEILKEKGFYTSEAELIK